MCKVKDTSKEYSEYELLCDKWEDYWRDLFRRFSRDEKDNVQFE